MRSIRFVAVATLCSFIFPGLTIAAGVGSSRSMVSQQDSLPVVKIFMSPDRVGRDLRDRGYSDIKWIDRWLPRYVVEACRGGDRFRLRLNRNAKILRQQRMGGCDSNTASDRNSNDRRNQPRRNDRNQRAVLRPAELRPLLRSRGFTNIQITDRELPGYRAEACRNNNRLELRMNRFGAIKRRDRIGKCNDSRNQPRRNDRNQRAALRPADLRPLLRSRGFTKIQITDRELPGYRAEACRNNNRLELRMNRFGEIKRRDRIGKCNDRRNQPQRNDRNQRAALRAADLRPLLRSRGFTNIKITDRELPGYRAEACRGSDRFDLRMNRFGEIKRRNRIGDCDMERAEGIVRGKDLRPLLRSRGFSRIEIVDGQLPRYVAKACKNNRRFRIVLNRFGGIKKKRNIGSCDRKQQAKGNSLSEIRQTLRNRRYYDIKFTDRELPGYGATACRNVRRFNLRLNRFGAVRKRKAIGWCKPGSEIQILKAPRRRITSFEIDSTERLQAADCQDYLESLLEQDSILFEVNSSAIDRQSYRLLRRLARTANRCPDARIEVAGHTDSDGSGRSNQVLSERRADAVVKILLDEGVSRRRVAAVGYGEERPVAPNRSAAQKARNRRIEFLIDWDEER